MTAFLEKVARGIAGAKVAQGASTFEQMLRAEVQRAGLVWQQEMFDSSMRDFARAAVEAMREPSDLMVEAGGEQIPWEEGWGSPAPQVCLAFQAMIGAALGEEG